MASASGPAISGHLSAISELFPLVVYTAMALILVGGLLLGAWWLGEKRTGLNKGAAYESGVLPSGSARLAYPVPFYLVAIFFIVFDVESVFIFIWAVAWDLLGIQGLIHITVFITVLLLGLLWLWRKGGLDWGPKKSSTLTIQGSETTADTKF